MLTTEQKQKLLKAKVALALRDEFGTIPKEEDIEYTFRLARILYKAMRGTSLPSENNRGSKATGFILNATMNELQEVSQVAPILSDYPTRPG